MTFPVPVRTPSRRSLFTRLAPLVIIPFLMTHHAHAADPDGKTPIGNPHVTASLKQFVDAGEIPGAVTLVALDGKIVQAGAIGVSDVKTKRPQEVNDLFYIASMSKPVAAACLMTLVEDGKLKLDDPLEKYLPEFAKLWVIEEKTPEKITTVPAKKIITIRDLLRHTHGLGDPLPLKSGALMAERVRADAIPPLHFEPGSKWEYGNQGLDVACRVLEILTGKSYEDFVKERLLDPLGMKDTVINPNPEQAQRLSKRYDLVEGQLVERPMSDGATPLRPVMPGGAFLSTAADCFRFYQMLANGGELEGKRFLAESSVKEMLSNQTGDLKAGWGEGMCYGLGCNLLLTPQGDTATMSPGSWGHDGAAGTSAFYDPVRKLLMIHMIQKTNNHHKLPTPIRDVFQIAAVKSVGGTVTEAAPKPAAPKPAELAPAVAK